MKKEGFNKHAAWLMVICMLAGLLLTVGQSMSAYAEEPYLNEENPTVIEVVYGEDEESPTVIEEVYGEDEENPTVIEEVYEEDALSQTQDNSLQFESVMFMTAEVTLIPSGDFPISASGDYQLANDFSGIITIKNTANAVELIGNGSEAVNSASCIVIEGDREEELHLTLEDIKLAAVEGYPGIDFSSADDYPNYLYLRGENEVTGDNNSGIRVPKGVELIIDKAADISEDSGGKLSATGGGSGAGIGAPYEWLGEFGSISIRGGTVIATGAGGWLDENWLHIGGTGIGGGVVGSEGRINISGGIITALGGEAAPGIGGGSFESGEIITISGGTVTATGGRFGAGIGPGTWSGSERYGIITISGGIVSATGGQFASGIGSSRDYHVSGFEVIPEFPVKVGAINISGGIIEATGGNGGAGIGGDVPGDISISGGEITALGGGAGSGIGGIDYGLVGLISISGGTIEAEGGTEGSGIGGGSGSGSYAYIGEINISGGTIEAAGGTGGAGIGSRDTEINTIDISGGTITATGGAEGVGIGSKGLLYNISISDGVVTATGGIGGAGIGGTGKELDWWYVGPQDTISISGGIVTAIGGRNEAGIGCGDGPRRDIGISGGTITAIGGENGAGIGGGLYDAGCNVTITGMPMVYSTGHAASGAMHIGNGSLEESPGTLKDGSDVDLSYLWFSASGVSEARIGLEGSDDEYMTNGQRIAGIFVPCSGSASYTVSKAGYAAVRGTQALSLMNHDINIAMVENIPPNIEAAGGNISVSNTTRNGTILAWNKASDNATAGAELKYCVYISSGDNINTVADIEANGIVKQDYTADIPAINITGLQPETTYYFNVIVRDNAGNKTCYNKATVTTRKASSGNSATQKPNETTIPVKTLAGAAGKSVEIKTELATLILPSNMLTPETAGNAVSVTLTVSRADAAKFPEGVQARIGNRPVIELTLKLDGKTISWNNPNAPVTVTVPYKPTAEELANPENITVWYIEVAGNIISVPSGRYDAATGTVSFMTTHFSKYAVVYVSKSFSDLAKAPWAKKQIEVLAAKGIMSGRMAAEFAPVAGITRAEYISALVRTLGLSAKVDANFSDVKAGDVYYNEIGIAKMLGITSGVGNNSFKPEATITRQEMLVMTERALRSLKKISKTGTMEDLKQFSDRDQLAAYSINSVSALVMEGLIEGSGGRLNVGSDTTRAEAAVFLYRIYNKY